MNSKIFLVCILLTGCVFAEETATDSPEKPEEVTKPEPKDNESSTLNGLNNKTEETVTSSGEEQDKTNMPILSVMKSNQNSSSEETTDGTPNNTSPSKVHLLDSVAHFDSVANSDPTPSDNEETTEKQTKKSPKIDDGEKPTTDASNSGEESNNKATNAPSGEDESTPTHKKKETAPPSEDSSQKPAPLSDSKIAAIVNPNPLGGFKGAEFSDTKTAATPAKPPSKPKDNFVVIGDPTPKALADHKMTPTEQQAYVCSLDRFDLCPMTVDLDEQVGIAEPGANAQCKDLAATMGYLGFCVVLMKTDPETGDPIYTRTCAYTDPTTTRRSTCTTSFLTSTTVANVSQIRYNCDNNGITNYIPTSCVKKHKELVLP